MTRDLITAACTLVTALLSYAAWAKTDHNNFALLMAMILALMACILNLYSAWNNRPRPVPQPASRP